MLLHLCTSCLDIDWTLVSGRKCCRDQLVTAVPSQKEGSRTNQQLSEKGAKQMLAGKNTPLLALQMEASGKSGLLVKAKERSRERGVWGTSLKINRSTSEGWKGHTAASGNSCRQQQANQSNQVRQTLPPKDGRTLQLLRAASIEQPSH